MVVELLCSVVELLTVALVVFPVVALVVFEVEFTLELELV